MNTNQKYAPGSPEECLGSVLRGHPLEKLVCFVGGCVRDRILQATAALPDLDLVVESSGGAKALAEDLHRLRSDLFGNPHELGVGYPIWQVAFIGEPFAGVVLQIADTQREMFPDPLTRQRISSFGSLAEDCARRDFSVNMLYQRVCDQQILDPSGIGLVDLKAGILRGYPGLSLDKAFSDDPLRMLRLIRFQCCFGWQIGTGVLDSVRRCAGRIQILSAERIRDEFIKIIHTGHLRRALELFAEGEILGPLFPELTPMIGCEQDHHYHSEGDVWVHTLAVIDAAPKNLELQLAALLHDIGKPATRSVVGDRVKFLGHEKISVQLGQEFLTRFKFERSLVQSVLKLVKLHLRGGDAMAWKSTKPARKLMRDVGAHLSQLLELIHADSRASLGPDGKPRLEHLAAIEKWLQLARLIPVAARPLLDGNTIMKALGVGPGPVVKKAQAWLTQIEDEYADLGKVLTVEDALRELKDFQDS